MLFKVRAVSAAEHWVIGLSPTMYKGNKKKKSRNDVPQSDSQILGAKNRLQLRSRARGYMKCPVSAVPVLPLLLDPEAGDLLLQVHRILGCLVL